MLLLFYGVCLAGYLLLGRFSGYSTLPSENSFLHWDAMHYQTIRDHGYGTGMVAFFPLFPLLWKLSFAGSIGISILNGLIYITSFSWLASIFNIDQKRVLLLASTPSLIFMFLPFSEAVFFLSCTILLAGLVKKQTFMMITGILLAGLTRPVATVFIPSLLLMYFLQKGNLKNEIQLLLKLSGVCIAVFILLLFIQYLQTGEWFIFFKVQRNWENYLRLPEFPLSSWAGGLIVRLDALAFFAGIAAGFYILYLLYRKLKSGIQETNPALLFSLCYLSFMALIVLFTRGGVLNSLNRYIFCTAFFIVALHELLNSKGFSGKTVLLIFLSTGIFWLLFGSYVHIQTILKFMLISLYLVLLFCITAENRFLRNTGYFGVITCNIFFMLMFFNRFLTGEWVG